MLFLLLLIFARPEFIFFSADIFHPRLDDAVDTSYCSPAAPVQRDCGTQCGVAVTFKVSVRHVSLHVSVQQRVWSLTEAAWVKREDPGVALCSLNSLKFNSAWTAAPRLDLPHKHFPLS